MFKVAKNKYFYILVPEIPERLRATDIQSTEMSVEWSKPSVGLTDGYNIRYEAEYNKANIPIAVADNKFTLKELQPGYLHCVKITSVSNGKESNSLEKRFRTGEELHVIN